MWQVRERRAIAEADRWAKWQSLLKDKRRAYEKAQRRTTTELKSALDAGGSVWVFGTGPFGEFTAPAPKVLAQGEHEFEHYDVIRVRRSDRSEIARSFTAIGDLGMTYIYGGWANGGLGRVRPGGRKVNTFGRRGGRGGGVGACKMPPCPNLV